MSQKKDAASIWARAFRFRIALLVFRLFSILKKNEVNQNRYWDLFTLLKLWTDALIISIKKLVVIDMF